jgi:hypothetical protein
MSSVGDDLADAPAKQACTDNPRKVNGSKSAHEETMMSKDAQGRRVPWNKRRLIRPKPPLKPKHVWSVRIRLQLAPPIAAVKNFRVRCSRPATPCPGLAAHRLDHAVEKFDFPDPGLTFVPHLVPQHCVLPAAFRHALPNPPCDGLVAAYLPSLHDRLQAIVATPAGRLPQAVVTRPSSA